MLTKKILMSFGVAMMILGCNGSSSSPSPKSTDHKVTVSECQKDKNTRSFATATNGIVDNRHTHIAHHYENGTLTLTHHNVAFNCDKRGIGATAKIEGDSITITERQNLPTGGGMRCMCLYDVAIILEDIEAKSYTINYDDGISTDIHFSVDLSEMPDGVKSFARTEYPYAQDSSTGTPSEPNIVKVIVDEIHTGTTLPKLETKVLKSKDELDSTVLELKEIGVAKTDELAEILENLSIDFTKEKLLTHTFEIGCIYEYAEIMGTNSNGQELTIGLVKTREECDTAMNQHYLAYKISNSIKKVKLEMLGLEAIDVDMGNGEINQVHVESDIFFPTLKEKPTVNLQARLSGVLKQDANGCLRVNGELIIFPKSSSLKKEQDSIVIYNQEDEQIAKVNEEVIFGGGGFGSNEGGAEALKDIEKSSDDLPSSRCLEPYFLLHSVVK